MKIINDDLVLQIVKTYNVDPIERQVLSWLHQETSDGTIMIRYVQFVTCHIQNDKLTTYETNFEQDWIQQDGKDSKRTQITQATVQWPLERPLLVWKQYKNWNDGVLNQLLMNFTHPYWKQIY